MRRDLLWTAEAKAPIFQGGFHFAALKRYATQRPGITYWVSPATMLYEAKAMIW